MATQIEQNFCFLSETANTNNTEILLLAVCVQKNETKIKYYISSKMKAI